MVPYRPVRAEMNGLGFTLAATPQPQMPYAVQRDYAANSNALLMKKFRLWTQKDKNYFDFLLGTSQDSLSVVRLESQENSTMAGQASAHVLNVSSARTRSDHPAAHIEGVLHDCAKRQYRQSSLHRNA